MRTKSRIAGALAGAFVATSFGAGCTTILGDVTFDGSDNSGTTSSTSGTSSASSSSSSSSSGTGAGGATTSSASSSSGTGGSAPTCSDGMKNGDETDVDCGGGTCPACAPTKACAKASDCTSSVCTSDVCQPPTCTDDTKNEDETDVDCGGSTCGPCANGKACMVKGDCASLVCTSNLCVAPTCMDGVKNGGETDVDCGGPDCAPCGAGKGCSATTDCTSFVCTSNACAAATCTDDTKNEDETDVDCGGSTCPACAVGKACNQGSDCASLVCTSHLCASPSCSDHVKNGTETDLDCGGSCGATCGLGKGCSTGADCASGVCNGGTCDEPIVGLSARWGHACGFRTPGVLKCWGINSSGELGLGDSTNRGSAPNQMGANLPVVSLGTGRTVKQVATGGDFTCAILDNASVKCWGKNDHGQLGLGDTITRGNAPNEMGDILPTVNLGTGRTAVAISAGNQHVCAILDDGSLKCWGYNADGELGLGDKTDRGTTSGQMGDSLPAVSLGTGRTAVAVGAGSVDTCVVLDDKSLKCWGYNYGAGGYANQMGDKLAPLDLGTGLVLKQFSPGASHACALFTNGTVKCWGYNLDGRCGLGNTTQYASPSSLGDNLPFVNLGTGRTATFIATQSNSACAILDDTTVKCWGWNADGQLGIGDTTLRGNTAFSMGDNLPTVSLGAGRKVVTLWPMGGGGCAVLDDGTFKCWGQNNYGQLGLGDSVDRGAAPNQMGDNLPPVLF